MTQITTLGLDLGNASFKYMELTRPVKLSCGRSCNGRRWPASLPILRPASSASKPALPLTIGLACSALTGTRVA